MYKSFFPNADLGKVWRGEKEKKPELQRNGKKMLWKVRPVSSSGTSADTDCSNNQKCK